VSGSWQVAEVWQFQRGDRQSRVEPKARCAG
jgi:hypothetical protein